MYVIKCSTVLSCTVTSHSRVVISYLQFVRSLWALPSTALYRYNHKNYSTKFDKHKVFVYCINSLRFELYYNLSKARLTCLRHKGLLSQNFTVFEQRLIDSSLYNVSILKYYYKSVVNIHNTPKIFCCSVTNITIYDVYNAKYELFACKIYVRISVRYTYVHMYILGINVYK